jgi:hypothetical protein
VKPEVASRRDAADDGRLINMYEAKNVSVCRESRLSAFVYQPKKKKTAPSQKSAAKVSVQQLQITSAELSLFTAFTFS